MSIHVKSLLAAFVAGLVFGFGLIVSEMVNPARVIGFLDVAGAWDPTLAFVMGAALIVTGVGYKIVLKRASPFFGEEFHVPVSTILDRRLVIGAILFGIGWGLGGLCPGPALVGMASLNGDILLFVFSMLAGIVLFEWFNRLQRT